MTRRIPIVSIRLPSDSGRGGTKNVEFIRCVDVREPQKHKIWSLGSNGITCEVHPTAQVDVGAGTMGQLLTDYLAENGGIIPIFGQIYINGSVKIWGIPDFHRTSGPMFIENLRSPHYTTDWRHGGTSNHNWPAIAGGSYQNISIACRDDF